MKRISWDQLFLETALLMSKRSTCLRVQVGSVLVKNNRIISTGYNGVPSGQLECCDHFEEYFKEIILPDGQYGKTFEDYILTQHFKFEHRDFSVHNEIHAESNVIGYAARNGINTDESCIYLTISPCQSCAKLLIASGIKRVVYINEYDRSEDNGLPLLQKNNIACEHIKI